MWKSCEREQCTFRSEQPGELHLCYSYFLYFQGDSGGALICDGVVVGMTRGGTGLNDTDTTDPSVFTDLAQYWEFINETMLEN
jgi:secreted trypsin-like serine protease